ncbi:ribonucleoside-diphosphate reductase [Deinococcus sp. 6YEL10]|uniref:hypothetical protein n=1 Tax=Deinococcus sp. 6YEL10 TaxID=2745870 RepID=UPI001E47E2BF|nr:hypothetical protein [Deinococcus sp. 6YEL10]MCD0159752.1 ribonucleoside-diphosphate reductase [Deinococcus sp. 6YEL10]
MTMITRPLMRGMGEAVARRTVLRHLDQPHEESWFDVSVRVAQGNTKLHPSGLRDFTAMQTSISTGKLLLSGRHLQHGDITQPGRNQEVFTNCSTAASSHLLFLLLLNGSGVGRAYDDALMLVDWSNYLPTVRCVLSADHADYIPSTHAPSTFSVEKATQLQGQTLIDEENRTIHHIVSDSREGWAVAVELLETLTFGRQHADWKVYLDFSAVRKSGSPILGMQGRPASGPVAFMDAIEKIVKWTYRTGLTPWKATIVVDHFLAECVVVGGARRAARMATKWWGDEGIFEFISLKADYLDEYGYAVLWSSNNSIGVDKAFWEEAKQDGTRAQLVAQAAAEYSYGANGKKRLGEPGFLNLDELASSDEGLEDYADGKIVTPGKFTPTAATEALYAALVAALPNVKYKYICNPCGEIKLFVLGGYCVIADIVPLYTDSTEDLIEVASVAARALIRVNLMPSIYSREVRRTNRIGIGFTGFHEWAFDKFGATWYDLLDDTQGPGKALWETVSHVRERVTENVRAYCEEIGVNMPHSIFTVKPAGTTSKLFGLTEGAHLPAMRAYLRNVQFKSSDPLVAQYRAKGYPVRELVQYSGMTIVGFPTVPVIAKTMPEALIVTAPEATPEDQYQYLRLFEKHWMGAEFGNQISYTLKIDTDKVSFADYYTTLVGNQGTIRACSVMPISTSDMAGYEYLPEEEVSVAALLEIVDRIDDSELKEAIDYETLACSSGACPI